MIKDIIADQLIYSTARIICSNATEAASGTGFFMLYEVFFATPKCRKLQSKNADCCTCKIQKVAGLRRQPSEVFLHHADIFCHYAGCSANAPAKRASVSQPRRVAAVPVDVIAPNYLCAAQPR